MSEYPPFRFHGAHNGGPAVPASDIRGQGSNVVNTTSGIDAVLASVRSQHSASVAAADGDLTTPLAGARHPVDRAGGNTSQLATFAGGCIDQYADAVEVFDTTGSDPRSITKLNAAWSDGLATDFGVPGARVNIHMDAETRRATHDAHDTAVTQARQALASALIKDHGRLTNQLNEAAHAVADLLKAGPTTEAVQSLWSNGNLPPWAAMHWPGIGLDASDLPVEQQRALRDYLVKHPELLTSGKPWVTDAIDQLPSGLQTDVQVMQRKQQLHEAGLLPDVNATNPWYDEWIRNTLDNDVDLSTVEDIAETHDIRPDDFDVLGDIDGTVDDEGNAMQDNTGKWFFLLPTDISGDDAQKAVLMTYIMNAGTGYRDGKDTDGYGDYTPEDYDADEIQRIIDRQNDNEWFSYDQDVGFVHNNGGRLVTTPNGMLMGAGGNDLQDAYSFSGGTTYGDIFMINEGDLEDPSGRLREIIESGDNPVISDPDSDKDLDRLLHHEEIHSQQYADKGLPQFLAGYLTEAATSGHWEWHDNPGPIPGKHPVWVSDQTENDYEQDAGLSDGNYTADP